MSYQEKSWRDVLRGVRIKERSMAAMIATGYGWEDYAADHGITDPSHREHIRLAFIPRLRFVFQGKPRT